MTKTDYKINEKNGSFVATVNDKVVCSCIDEESTLHAIWVIEGKKYDDFYVCNDGNVSRIDRGVL